VLRKAKITKAIICCGGQATRFRPISRAVPKEMLPIGDKPVIHFILKELSDAGVTDVLLLIGKGRESLQVYLDEFPNLNVYYRRVPVPRGPADNIWHAKSFVKNEYFLTAYCDDVFFEGNPSRELIEKFELDQKAYICCWQVEPQHAHQYGIFANNKLNEKPKEYIGNLAAVGRYILPPSIFKIIESEMGQCPDKEICMTAQFNKLCKKNALAVHTTGVRRFDTGTPRGLNIANKYYFKK